MVEFDEKNNKIFLYYLKNKKKLYKPSNPYKHPKNPSNLVEMREYRKINHNLNKKFKSKYNNRIKKYYTRLRKKSQYIKYDFKDDIDSYLKKVKKQINMRRELECNIDYSSLSNLKYQYRSNYFQI